MTAEQIFQVSNFLAAAGWLILIAGWRVRRVALRLTGVIVPLMFAVLYTWLIVAHWGTRTGGFGTITEVRSLFSNDWLLLAGWVHYLAFDLFVGSWQVRDAQKHKVPFLFVAPCLIVTFLFGPVGFLLYCLVRLPKVGREDIASAG
jgi:hypothetical protein